MDEPRYAHTSRVRGQPRPTCGRWPTGCSARVSEADDAVQEAWLRLSRTERGRGRQPRRLADDRRRARLPRHAARAQVTRARSRSARTCPSRSSSREAGVDPEHEALLADSVGLALLVVLETLTPAERLAFVLHDMFAVPFDEIAPIVDRSPEAARQLASRARRRVQRRGARAPTPTSPPSARSSMRSSPPRATATSRRCSRCSTPTSSCGSTAAPSPAALARGPRRRGGRRAGACGSPRWRPRPARRWSTARPGSSSSATAGLRGRRVHGRRRPDRRDRPARRPRPAARDRPDDPVDAVDDRAEHRERHQRDREDAEQNHARQDEREEGERKDPPAVSTAVIPNTVSAFDSFVACIAAPPSS